MIKLGVNIDHVATVRQARGGAAPSVIDAAMAAERGGADSITAHLREDRRHIQDADIDVIRAEIATSLNLEMAATEEMVRIARRVSPKTCCIVPEKRQELTTEGGLDVLAHREQVKKVCEQLAEDGILVSLFIDPDLRQIEAARACGAPVIEIHTGRYADAATDSRDGEFKKIVRAAEFANECGLIPNAGHGLNYENVSRIAAIEMLNELNIGHSIVARAIFVGLEVAVTEMKRLMTQARQ